MTRRSQAQALQDRITVLMEAGTLVEILDRGEASKRVLDEGRERGQRENKNRAQTHRERWRQHAIELKAEKPHLTLEALAVEVVDWCKRKGFRFKSGKSYSFRTIYDDLKKHALF
jgi:hypothetical protein